jgi:hypothetical protein
MMHHSAGKKNDDFPLDSSGVYGLGWSNSRPWEIVVALFARVKRLC